MTARAKGLALAATQVALLFAIGGRYVIDRARLPHGWARTAPYDPELPIRGRYLSLALEVETRGTLPAGVWTPVEVEVEGDRVVARPPRDAGRATRTALVRTGDPGRARLSGAIAFFLPEHAPDPTRRPPGEELWAEVTVPPAGDLRPLRLGVMRGGVLTPLALD